jgi:phage gp46-like protein
MAPGNPIRLEQWIDIRELVRMSVGTDKDSWWADPAFGSDLWILRREGKVNGRTAGTFRRMVLECLQWIKDDGLAADIDCRAERSGKNEITYTVTALRPGGDPVTVQDVWYGL